MNLTEARLTVKLNRTIAEMLFYLALNKINQHFSGDFGAYSAP